MLQVLDSRSGPTIPLQDRDKKAQLTPFPPKKNISPIEHIPPSLVTEVTQTLPGTQWFQSELYGGCGKSWPISEINYLDP